MIRFSMILPALLACTSLSAFAGPNVITDWDEKGTAVIQGFAPAAPRVGASGSTRIMAIMHLAMFEAVNAIDTKYEGYKGAATPDVGCSQQAAAATAAAAVLINYIQRAPARRRRIWTPILRRSPLVTPKIVA